MGWLSAPNVVRELDVLCRRLKAGGDAFEVLEQVARRRAVWEASGRLPADLDAFGRFTADAALDPRALSAELSRLISALGGGRATDGTLRGALPWGPTGFPAWPQLQPEPTFLSAGPDRLLIPRPPARRSTIQAAGSSPSAAAATRPFEIDQFAAFHVMVDALTGSLPHRPNVRWYQLPLSIEGTVRTTLAQFRTGAAARDEQFTPLIDFVEKVVAIAFVKAKKNLRLRLNGPIFHLSGTGEPVEITLASPEYETVATQAYQLEALFRLYLYVATHPPAEVWAKVYEGLTEDDIKIAGAIEQKIAERTIGEVTTHLNGDEAPAGAARAEYLEQLRQHLAPALSDLTIHPDGRVTSSIWTFEPEGEVVRTIDWEIPNRVLPRMFPPGRDLILREVLRRIALEWEAAIGRVGQDPLRVALSQYLLREQRATVANCFGQSRKALGLAQGEWRSLRAHEADPAPFDLFLERMGALFDQLFEMRLENRDLSGTFLERLRRHLHLTMVPGRRGSEEPFVSEALVRLLSGGQTLEPWQLHDALRWEASTEEVDYLGMIRERVRSQEQGDRALRRIGRKGAAAVARDERRAEELARQATEAEEQRRALEAQKTRKIEEAARLEREREAGARQAAEARESEIRRVAEVSLTHWSGQLEQLTGRLEETLRRLSTARHPGLTEQALRGREVTIDGRVIRLRPALDEAAFRILEELDTERARPLSEISNVGRLAYEMRQLAESVRADVAFLSLLSSQ